MLLSSTSYAGVTDNLNGWLINFLGVGKEGNVPSSYSGSLIERVNYLEKENRELKSSLATLSKKVDTSTATLGTKIEESAQAANASYSLYVYIPKSSATGNYAGQQVTITAPSGNQTAKATLKDDGTNYSTTLYFNFSGDCSVSYNLVSGNYTCPTVVQASVTAAGQELLLTTHGATFSVAYGGSTYWFMAVNDKATRCVYLGTGSSAGANKNASLGSNTKANGYTVAASTASKPYLALASKFKVTNSTSKDSSDCALLLVGEATSLTVSQRKTIYNAAGGELWISGEYDVNSYTYQRYIDKSGTVQGISSSLTALACVPAYTISKK